MKKIIFLGLCLGIMISCNTNKKGENDKSKSDSLSNINGKAILAFLDDAEFITSDLLLFEVKGHVKEVKYHRENPYVITFDKNGMLASCNYNNEYKDFKFENGKAVGKYFSSKRNNKGQLTEYAYRPEGELCYFLDVKEITYNADGRVSKLLTSGWESMCETEYKYNNEGLCIEEVDDAQMESLVYKATTTYTYTKFDEQGNWTERKCKQHSEEWTFDEEDDKTITNEEKIEKRTIIYY